MRRVHLVGHSGQGKTTLAVAFNRAWARSCLDVALRLMEEEHGSGRRRPATAGGLLPGWNLLELNE